MQGCIAVCRNKVETGIKQKGVYVGNVHMYEGIVRGYDRRLIKDRTLRNQDVKNLGR